MPGTPGIYFSHTALVNPKGATPVLTREQVWAGLKIKVDAGQSFVPVIASTDVISKSEDVHGHQVTLREVVFKNSDARVREECVHYPPNKVIFKQANGSLVSNIIGDGPDGELYLTYDFETLFPGGEEKNLEEEYKKNVEMAKKAVEGSLVGLRKMVEDGRIQ